MLFQQLFNKPKPIIGVIHLKALIGAPLYRGNLAEVYQKALHETAILSRYVDGLIIENFGDAPFFPDTVPPETVAMMSAVGREIRQQTDLPIGINVLRNDALAAMAIATAIQAQFIRVNVHTSAVVADQGIIEGKAYATLRLKQQLQSNVLILADVGVKHAASLTPRSLALEAEDLAERALVDGLIVSGTRTGEPTQVTDLQMVQQEVKCPVLIGSGVTPTNIMDLQSADGFIVGSYFKKDGKAQNTVEEKRVVDFMEASYVGL